MYCARPFEPVAVEVEPGGYASDHVVLNRQMLGHTGRTGSLLVHRPQHEREACLSVRPRVLDDVAFDQDTASRLELDGILHHPTVPFQLNGFATWLWRISMSDGMSPGIDGSPPPNAMFSAAPSR